MSLTVGPVDVYDIANQRWQTLAEPLPTERAGTGTANFNGMLVVLGGESGTQATVFNGALHIVAGSGNRGGGPELNDHWIMDIEE